MNLFRLLGTLPSHQARCDPLISECSRLLSSGVNLHLAAENEDVKRKILGQ